MECRRARSDVTRRDPKHNIRLHEGVEPRIFGVYPNTSPSGPRRVQSILDLRAQGLLGGPSNLPGFHTTTGCASTSSSISLLLIQATQVHHSARLRKGVYGQQDSRRNEFGSRYTRPGATFLS